MYGKVEEYVDLPGSYNLVNMAFKMLAFMHISVGILLLVFSAIGTFLCQEHHCREWGGSIYVHGGLALLYVLLGAFAMLFAKKRTLSGVILLVIFVTFSFTASLVTLGTNYIFIKSQSFSAVWMVLYVFTGVLILLEFVLSSLTVLLVGKVLFWPSPSPKQDGPC